MFQLRVKLVFELVSRASGAGSGRTASLYHEIRYNPMKGQAVVIGRSGAFGRIGHLTFGKTNEISDGSRSFVMCEFDEDLAFCRIEFCVNAFLHSLKI